MNIFGRNTYNLVLVKLIKFRRILYNTLCKKETQIILGIKLSFSRKLNSITVFLNAHIVYFKL